MFLAPNHAKARRIALARDNYTCQHCGISKHDPTAKLTVHHIKSQRSFPELARDVDNLLTLCYDCHKTEEKRLYLACEHVQSGSYVMTHPRLIAHCAKCLKLFHVTKSHEEERHENG